MTAIIGLLGAILGALLGSVATYLTTRSNMRLTLEHSYDLALQGTRLERYQALFHITECLPRYWPPMIQEPGRKDLQQYLQNFHDWYFGEEAGGMSLDRQPKDTYMRLLNLLAEVAFAVSSDPGATADHPISASESQSLRKLLAISGTSLLKMWELPTRPVCDGHAHPRSLRYPASAGELTQLPALTG